MKLLINNIILPVEHDEELIYKCLDKEYNIKKADIKNTYINKKSFDARFGKKRFIYSIIIEVDDNYKYQKSENIKKYFISDELSYPKKNTKYRPIIIGFGPAGMFCALYFARCGLKPIVIEQGLDVDARMKAVNDFLEKSILDEKCNVQFGEGGAGTFSDGKLTTNLNNPLIKFILKEFVKHGAKEDILYEANPHVGTDYIMKVVKNIREEIISLGGEMLFNHQLHDIQNEGMTNQLIVSNEETMKTFVTDICVLALGHSARETFVMLKKRQFALEAKNFSIGVRIEHLQEDIDKAQYKELSLKSTLKRASYKLSHHLQDGRGVYTFCMCPGGVVMASSSNHKEIVTNGMSYNARNGKNANSAILVSVTKDDFYNNDALAGMYFQQKYEQLAYKISNSYLAPCQLVGDFMKDKVSHQFGKIEPTYKPGVVFADLKECLPAFAIDALKEALRVFETKIKGFACDDAILTGVETRSSSPLRILRDKFFESNIKGIYPAGEGAGYAGGITSAALDGLKIAMSIVSKL